jgi:hypothetical protein
LAHFPFLQQLHLGGTNKKAVQMNGFFALLTAHPINGGSFEGPVLMPNELGGD